MSDIAFVLDRPNTWLHLMEYFKEPELVNQYMASSCETTDVRPTYSANAYSLIVSA